jgi:hypothetical protein
MPKVEPMEAMHEAEPTGEATTSDKSKPAPALAGTFRIVHDPEENAFYFTRHPS